MPYSEGVTTWTREWRRPRLTIYAPHDPTRRFIWNRYGDVLGREGVVIGAAVVLRGRCYSLTWARPKSRTERVTS